VVLAALKRLLKVYKKKIMIFELWVPKDTGSPLQTTSTVNPPKPNPPM
jgi:hypothetical protein